MRTDLFDYHLPEDLIAQHPIEPRDAARVLVARVGAPACQHRHVRDLCDLLDPDDLVVLNHTRVIPARLHGHKTSGGAVEVLLVHPLDPVVDDPRPRWRCLVRGKVRPGAELTIADADAEVTACAEDGARDLAFAAGTDVLALAEAHGHIPLPPYIRRPDTAADRDRYQTVFARHPGSVAAPTASLHLTSELLDALAARGINTAAVDLSVGPGTFKPVQSTQLEDHRIHAEFCRCPAATIAAITACRRRGGRVVAIGTTVVRTLETAARQDGGLAAWAGWSRLYLHPPQRFQVVDALLTNFHLPRSTLLMLVACLTGIDRLHALYRAAIAERYRFYSYGDAMLILP